MSLNFVDVVEEIIFLIGKYLIEEKRENIYSNYKKSLDELSLNKLEFTNDISKLKESLNENMKKFIRE